MISLLRKQALLGTTVLWGAFALSLSAGEISRDIEILEVPADWRKKSPASNSSYRTLLAALPENTFPSSAEMEIFRSHGSQAIRDLQKLLKHGSPEEVQTALNAASLLDQLGSPLGRKFAFKLLADPSSDTRFKTLLHIDYWKNFSKKFSREESSLLKSLLNDPDKRVQGEAFYLFTSDALMSGTLLAKLQDPEIPRRPFLAQNFLEKTSSRENALSVIGLARKNLPNTNPDLAKAWLDTLAVGARHSDPEVARASSQALDQAYLALPADWRSDTSFLDGIRDQLSSASLPALHEAANNKKTGTGRGHALVAIARLEGEKSLPLLLDSLSDPYLRYSAVKALASVIHDKNRAQILAALSQNYARVPPGEQELDFLILHGAEQGRALAGEQSARVSPSNRMALQWKLKGWKLENFVQSLQDAGLIKNAPNAGSLAEKRKEWLGYWGSHLDESKMALFLLEDLKLAHSFDAETDAYPVRHDLLILDLAKISGGKLPVTEAREEWLQKNPDDADAPYRVEFASNGKLFRFMAASLGDWYDLEMIHRALNRALQQKNAPERYLSIDTGGQDACFVFGDPALWRKIAGHYSLPLENTGGEAVKQGKDFEDKVKKNLEKDGPANVK